MQKFVDIEKEFCIIWMDTIQAFLIFFTGLKWRPLKMTSKQRKTFIIPYFFASGYSWNVTVVSFDDSWEIVREGLQNTWSWLCCYKRNAGSSGEVIHF